METIEERRQREHDERNRMTLKANEEEKTPEPKDGWIFIGTLKYIFMYLIDGGAACAQDNAYITKFGLLNSTAGNGSRDRCVVLFSLKNKQAKIRIHQDLEKLCSSEICDEVPLVLAQSEELKNVKIKYLEEDDILVKDLGENIAEMIQKSFGYSDVDLRLGARKPEERYDYNKKTRDRLESIDRLKYIELREPQTRSSSSSGSSSSSAKTSVHLETTPDLHPYSQNFSSFTLVNTRYIDKLNAGVEESQHIKYENFRPNFVVNGKGSDVHLYNEEDITAIKIEQSGDLKGSQDIFFTNIRPWTHNKSINPTLKSSISSEEELKEPYTILLKKRPLNTVYPSDQHKNCEDAPVFGINMELGSDDEEEEEENPMVVYRGQRVYAQFKSREIKKARHN